MQLHIISNNLFDLYAIAYNTQVQISFKVHFVNLAVFGVVFFDNNVQVLYIAELTHSAHFLSMISFQPVHPIIHARSLSGVIGRSLTLFPVAL